MFCQNIITVLVLVRPLRSGDAIGRMPPQRRSSFWLPPTKIVAQPGGPRKLNMMLRQVGRERGTLAGILLLSCSGFNRLKPAP